MNRFNIIQNKILSVFEILTTQNG